MVALSWKMLVICHAKYWLPYHGIVVLAWSIIVEYHGRLIISNNGCLIKEDTICHIKTNTVFSNMLIKSLRAANVRGSILKQTATTL
jgi:hypothetical protein